MKENVKVSDLKNRLQRPDAQGFDEVRITTVPRYKQSELSGDEWRISAKIEFLLKGQVRHTETTSSIASACHHLGYHHDHAADSGLAYYGGLDAYCDQEGCSELATRNYLCKKEYDRKGKEYDFYTPSYRLFCEKHKTRGDCGLEDADRNYIEVTP